MSTITAEHRRLIRALRDDVLATLGPEHEHWVIQEVDSTQRWWNGFWCCQKDGEQIAILGGLSSVQKAK